MVEKLNLLKVLSLCLFLGFPEFQMAQSSQVPNFGSWEIEENYTEYFENARRGRGGKRMNRNEPQDNTLQAPSLLQDAEVKGQTETAEVRSKHESQTSYEDVELGSTESSLVHDSVDRSSTVDLSRQNYGGVRSGSSKVELEEPKGSETLKPKQERQLSQEAGDLTKPTDSPLQHETVGQRATVDSSQYRHVTSTAETPKRVAQRNVGSDRNIDHSPRHQGKVGGKGSGISSPSWEIKRSSEGSHGLAPSTPGKSRLRSVTRGDDTPDQSTAVPKFGDWDESNPTAAEGFTQLFNKVREERHGGVGQVPATTTETSCSNGQRQYGNKSSKSCCWFPWGRK